MRYKLDPICGDEALSRLQRIGSLAWASDGLRPGAVLPAPAFVDGGATVPQYAIDELMRPISAPEMDLGIYLAADAILAGRRFLALDRRWVVWNRMEGQAMPVPEAAADTGFVVDASGQTLLDFDDRAVDVFLGRHVLLQWDAARMYHHWMFECATRVLAALNSDALAGFKFVFAMDRPSFVDQTLDLLGVPAERRVYYDPNRLALFESLALIPVPVFERHFLCTSALHDLRRELLKHVDVNDKERPRKIFFTRRDALTSERILINEAEVVAKLEAIGFKAFELGDVSVVEQIRLTHAADTVVYIHGSAGANLIFVKPGANVLHVFPDCVSFFVSHGIGTAAVGAKYGYLFGPSFQRSIRYHNNPWLVSPERTANAIKRLETQ